VTSDNDDAGRPEQSVFETITAASLANDRALRRFIARLMSNRFVQVRIEFLSNCFNRLQSIFGDEVFQLLEHETHPGKNRRLLAFATRRLQAELEMIDNRDQSLEEILVGVFDRVFFFSGATLFVIFKVGLTAHGKVAEPVQIGL
jgi:hypothetical protein